MIPSSFLYTIKWFQIFPSNMNNSIYYRQLNGSTNYDVSTISSLAI